MNDKAPSAFTLIELLVVIGIIAMLAALLSPALRKARDSARSIQCMSTLHNVGSALTAYTNENDGYLPWTTEGAEGYWGAYWQKQMAPYYSVRSSIASVGDAMGPYCPAFKGGAMTSPPYGYVWNYQHCGYIRNTTDEYSRAPFRLSEYPGGRGLGAWLVEPTRQVVVGDASDTADAVNGLPEGTKERYMYYALGLATGSIPTKHSGGLNVLLLDGHVEHLAARDLDSRLAEYGCQ